MLFFSQGITELNKTYASLFGLDDKDDENKGQEGEGESENGVEDDTEPVGFIGRWNWIFWVDTISELVRQNWDEVMRKNITEFLSLMCYRKDKSLWEKEQAEKWKKTH